MMTKKDIKRSMKNVYSIIPSDEERSFVRKHEQRKMHIMDILKLEFKYMGISSFPIGIILCIILFMIAKSDNVQFIWIVSSLLPICALMPMTALGKSESCGMNELEMACRFSLRLIKLIRMLILAVASVALLLVCGGLMSAFYGINLVYSIVCVGIPYLLNICGCLLLIRKWHAKENIYGCIGITGSSVILPSAVGLIGSNVNLPEYLVGGVFIAILVVTVREIIIYIKESENVSWSLS